MDRDIFSPHLCVNFSENFREKFEAKIEGKFSFEEFLQGYFECLKASACVFDGYFIDIGVPKDYQKARENLGG